MVKKKRATWCGTKRGAFVMIKNGWLGPPEVTTLNMIGTKVDTAIFCVGSLWLPSTPSDICKNYVGYAYLPCFICTFLNRLNTLVRQLGGRITRKMGHILTMISEKVSVVRRGQCLKFYTVKTAFFVHWHQTSPKLQLNRSIHCEGLISRNSRRVMHFRYPAHVIC